MTPFGKLVLGLLLLAVIGFAAIVRFEPVERGEAPRDGAEVGIMPFDLTVPVSGVRSAALVDTFGQPRGGGTRMHGALDIMAPRGTPVLAAASGRVEKIFESEAGGRTVYVRSPDDRWVYYYAHLDGYSPTLREGLAVERGQQLGFVGATGNASAEAPHLHFELKAMRPGERWDEGRPVNPYSLLTAGPNI